MKAVSWMPVCTFKNTSDQAAETPTQRHRYNAVMMMEMVLMAKSDPTDYISIQEAHEKLFVSVPFSSLTSLQVFP